MGRFSARLDALEEGRNRILGDRTRQQEPAAPDVVPQETTEPRVPAKEVSSDPNRRAEKIAAMKERVRLLQERRQAQQPVFEEESQSPSEEESQSPSEEGDVENRSTGDAIADGARSAVKGATMGSVGTVGNVLSTTSGGAKLLTAPGKFLASITYGIGTLLKKAGAEDVGQFFQDDAMVVMDTAQSLEESGDQTLGRDGVGGALRERSNETVEILDSYMSEGHKAQQESLNEELNAAKGSGIGNEAWVALKATMTRPSVAQDALIQSLAQMGAAAGPLITAGKFAGAGAATGKKLIAVETVDAAARVSADKYDDLLAMDSNVLTMTDKLVDYIVVADGDEELARKRWADDMASNSGITVGAAFGILQMIPGANVLEKTIVGERLKDVTSNRLARGGKSGGAEAVQEGLQEGAETIGGNAFDPSKGLLEDAGTSIGMGAGIGGGMGVAGGLASRTEPNQVAKTEQESEINDLDVEERDGSVQTTNGESAGGSGINQPPQGEQSGERNEESSEQEELRRSDASQVERNDGEGQANAQEGQDGDVRKQEGQAVAGGSNVDVEIDATDGQQRDGTKNQSSDSKSVKTYPSYTKPQRSEIMEDLAKGARSRDEFLQLLTDRVGPERASLMINNGEVKRGWLSEQQRRGDAKPSDVKEIEREIKKEERANTDTEAEADTEADTEAEADTESEVEVEAKVQSVNAEIDSLDIEELDVEDVEQARAYIRRQGDKLRKNAAFLSTQKEATNPRAGGIRSLVNQEATYGQVENIREATAQQAVQDFKNVDPTQNVDTRKTESDFVNSQLAADRQAVEDSIDASKTTDANRAELDRYVTALNTVSQNSGTGRRIFLISPKEFFATASKKDIAELNLSRRMTIDYFGASVTSTGAIFINRDMVTNPKDVTATLVHEALHFGMLAQTQEIVDSQNRTAQAVEEGTVKLGKSEPNNKPLYNAQKEMQKRMSNLYSAIQRSYPGKFDQFVEDLNLTTELSSYINQRGYVRMEEVLAFSSEKDFEALTPQTTKLAEALKKLINLAVPGYQFKSDKHREILQQVADEIKLSRANFETEFNIGLFAVQPDQSSQVASSFRFMTADSEADYVDYDGGLTNRYSASSPESGRVPSIRTRTLASLGRAMKDVYVVKKLEGSSLATWVKVQTAVSRMVGNDVITARDKYLAEGNAGKNEARMHIDYLESMIKKHYSSADPAAQNVLYKKLHSALQNKVDLKGKIPDEINDHIKLMRETLDNLSTQVAADLADHADTLIYEKVTAIKQIPIKTTSKSLLDKRKKLENDLQSMLEYREMTQDERIEFDDADNVPEAFKSIVSLHDTVINNKGEYVNRSFKIFEDNNWVDRVIESDKMDAAVEMLVEKDEAEVSDFNEALTQAASDRRTKAQERIDKKRKKDPNGDYQDVNPEDYEVDPDDYRTTKPKEVIRSDLRRYLRAIKEKSNNDAFQGVAQIGMSTTSIFRKKNNALEPEILELLGEHTDIRNSFSKSTIKLTDFIINNTFQRRVLQATLGTTVFHRDDISPEALENDVELVNTNRKDKNGKAIPDPFNLFAGYMTSEEFRRGIEGMQYQPVESDLMKAYMSIVTMAKMGKTVFNTGTHAVNFLSGLVHGIMHGHVDPLTSEGRKIIKETISLAANDLNLSGERDPSNVFAARQKMSAYMKKGIMQDNNKGGEVRSTIEDSYFTSADYGTLRKKVSLPFDKVKDAYSWEDDLWKVIAFEKEISRYKAKGETQQRAEELAAQRVRDLYWTYSKVPNWVKLFNRFPLVGTFVSWPYEMMRTSVNTVLTIRRDYQDGDRAHAVKRSIFATIAALGPLALAKGLNAWQGYDEEEVDGIRQMVAPWHKNGTLLMLGRDDQGNPRYLDLSRYSNLGPGLDVVNTMFSSVWDTPEKKVMAAAFDLAEPFIGMDMVAGPIIESIANNKFIGTDSMGGTRVRNPNDTTFKQTLDVADHISDALLPGVIGSGLRILRALDEDQNVSQSGKRYSVADEIAAALGFRRSTVDALQQTRNSAYRFRAKKTLSRSILGEEYRKASNVPEEDIEEAFHRTNEALEADSTQMHNLIKALRQQGQSNDDIANFLDIALSKKDVATLMAGKPIRFELNKEFKKSTIESMLNNASSVDRPILLQRHRDRQVLVNRLVSEQRQKDRDAFK